MPAPETILSGTVLDFEVEGRSEQRFPKLVDCLAGGGRGDLQATADIAMREKSFGTNKELSDMHVGLANQ